MADVKTIWVSVQRLDINEDQDENSDPVPIQFDGSADSDTVKLSLRNGFSLTEPDLIMKFRNSHGSLIPINNRIDTNTQSQPYLLEVVKLYQHVTPSESSVKLSTYSETVRSKLTEITNRIEAVEQATPELNNRRSEKIKAEMGELDQKIEFLHKRLNDANQTNWRGMFKKNPLW